MMRRRDEGWPHLVAAKKAYLAHFGEDAPMSSYPDHPRLPDVLLEAVERGELLTEATLAEQLSVGRRTRPPGPVR